MRIHWQFKTIQHIRNFFLEREFIDVMTPPMVENPGMEVHIHPFQVYSAHKKQPVDKYLHTSPEFCMKELLSLKEEGLDKIFNISYVFRDEPDSPIHRNQFLMLEWYRKNERYESIMQDVQELIEYTSEKLKEQSAPVREMNIEWQKVTVQEIIQEHLKIDILNFLDAKDLKNKIAKDFKDVPLPSSECDWDDYFFLLFLNKIEPHFQNISKLLLYEFPAPLAALSTLKQSDPRVAERFEVYLNGVELCNCFNELTDLSIQKDRFNQQALDKKRLYGLELPEPNQFYKSIERGLPPSAGVALGVERLLYSLLKLDNPFYF